MELPCWWAAGVRRQVICTLHKLLWVHDRANYFSNEAENAGRLEYYIVKSLLVNSVCDQILCCFKYHITCSILVGVNEYVWICQWICMPPNLINILANSTSSDVWHKLHPLRSRLAPFVYVSFISKPLWIGCRIVRTQCSGGRASPTQRMELKPCSQSKKGELLGGTRRRRRSQPQPWLWYVPHL